MKLGLVGLPNVGKSTLFNAVTKAGAHVANYPFATIDPNVGVVNVPDPRLEVLYEMYHPKRETVYATLEVVDIAGLVEGASHGEGLGNAFLGNIREVDAIGHVVRCFDDPNIAHVSGAVDPRRDIEIIEVELILADLAHVGRRLEKAVKYAKSGEAEAKAELAFLQALEAHLSESKPARSFQMDAEWPEGLHLLTAKPMLYIANVAEDDLDGQSPHVAVVREIAAETDAPVVVISARIEADLAELAPADRDTFAEALGLTSSGLDIIVKEAYALLDQISFLTVGDDEVRAWTITRGMKAPQAAGKIHTDFERGFIRAEVIDYDTLIDAGSMVKAKALGKVRSEGKEYVVEDGDIILFRFNV
ncbi:MAG TPA: redox-regulated ATPase YchF [Fastidiosipila sp.]|jgi:GTP-binding protein YchF|nr:redox-regulated ATPase YchF [Fastidiosipila sp.]